MFQKMPSKSTEINHSISLMEVSADNRFQEEDSRDRTLDWMMRPFFQRKDI